MKFEDLNFPEAPKIVGKLPGKSSLKILNHQQLIEGGAVSYPRNIPLVMDKGRGATILDLDGNIFIDFFSGAGVLALGHCNPIVMEAVRNQQEKLTHTLDFPTEIRLELIEKLRKIMPGKLRNKVKIQFGGPTGSDAVEMAIKLVKFYTKRHSLISFEGAYHGMTAGACSVTSGTFWKANYVPMLPDVHFLPYAYCYRCTFNKEPLKCNFECASYYEHILEDPHSGIVHPAGTIIEPIQGEGGSIIPPDGYIARIEEISQKYEVPIIVDEIQAGFCRTGKFFSFEHSNASPDIITLSKALGGGFPLSAIAYREDLDVWKKGAHIGTFRGNVVAMAAGVASVDFMVENNITVYVSELGNYMLNKLRKELNECRVIGEIRGKGLMLGIEIVTEKEKKTPSEELASTIRTECFKQGLLIEIGGHYNNVVRLLPPLILTKELATTGLDILIDVILKSNTEGQQRS
ncbi:MAG: aspartate aminotransferase family protein [Candidatus Hodarchaeales archaeon]|jgi:diaminobutyrate-2-oxoglutarate transaminase